MECVEHYSRTEFTNPGDRLVALSSLARAVDRNLEHPDLYCAGLWKSSLLNDLLWMRVRLPSSESPQRLNIAPTWSWASVQGEIWFQNLGIRPRALLSATSSVQVLDVKLVPSQRDNPYGNIKEGRLKLVAQVVDVCIWTEHAKMDKLGPGWVGTREALRLEIEEKDSQGYSKISRWIHWDEWQGNTKEEKEYKIVHVQSMHWGNSRPGVVFEWVALIVEQVQGTQSEHAVDDHVRTYRRIGVLRDAHYRWTEDHERLIAEAPMYNYGRSELRRETIVLV